MITNKNKLSRYYNDVGNNDYVVGKVVSAKIVRGIYRKPFFRSALFILCLLAAAALSAQDTGNPHPLSFNHILPDKLVSIGVVHAITQDKKGFMWFGGQNGLARYDGYAIQIYRNIPDDVNSLSHNYVWDLLTDDWGRVWVATRRGISIYDHELGKFSRLETTSPGLLKKENSQKTDSFKKASAFSGSTLSKNVATPPRRYLTEVVEALASDREGNIWFSGQDTGLVRFHLSTREMEYFLEQDTLFQSLNKAEIHTLLVDANNHVWLGTATSGIFVLDGEQKTLFQYQHEPGNAGSLSHNQVRKLYLDSNNTIWVGTFGGGLNRLDRKNKQFIHYLHDSEDTSSLSGNYVWDIAEDGRGNLWVATDRGGLNRYEQRKDGFTHYRGQLGNINGPAANAATSIFTDNIGDIWFGFSPGGVDVVYDHAPIFNNFRHNPFDSASLIHDEVLSIEEGDNGDLWVGTQEGLTHYEKATGQVKRYSIDKKDPLSKTSLPGHAVLSLLQDSDGNLWIGTWGGGLSRMDEHTQTFEHFIPKRSKQSRLSGDRIWALYEDQDKTVWIGTEQQGLSRFNPDEKSFTHFKPDLNDPTSISGALVSAIYEDSKGRFWVGTTHGLNLMDRESGTFSHFRYDKNSVNSLSAQWVKAIYEDSSGNLWVGTHGGGLNLLNEHGKNFKIFRTHQGLSDDVVTGILEDDRGYLWISGHMGLSRLNPKTWAFRNYTKRHGLVSNLFWRQANAKLLSGELAFGSINGFTIFDPANIRDNLYVPPIVITNFKLSNSAVDVGVEDSPLQKSASATDRIILNYKQSALTFEFSALNYRFSQNNQYAFRLLGFESDWQYVGSQRSATYTNLDPGKYTFQVKASNDEGVWNENGIEVELDIVPPWWQTWWAYLIYGLGITFLIYFIFRYQLERRSNRYLSQLHQVKDEFLAKTSHELRTPLNGIVGLIDSIVSGDVGIVPSNMRESLQMALLSGKRLANLINDIVDFSRIKENALELRQKNIDIRTAIDIVLTLTKPSVKKMSVALVNRTEKNLPFVWADEDRLQQILYNLIGNAVKYTDKGVIEVSALVRGSEMLVSVKDTGIGIARDKFETIFQLYEQAESHVGGSGLGLSITKQLVELHGGQIGVSSIIGKGATFTFSLPISKVESRADEAWKARLEYDEQQVISHAKKIVRNVQQLGDIDELCDGKTVNKVGADELVPTPMDDEHHILIVEDDHINRMIIHSYLATRYLNIIEAVNGVEALDIIQNNRSIDIILLDVVMPTISGYDVCKEIRKKSPREVLPIIFLSSINKPDGIKMGYRLGANDFLTKPILRDDLLERVGTHLMLSELRAKNIGTF